MEKAFSRGKTGKWPEKRRTGKRANEIECPEKGKGKAPDLKSEASLAIRWSAGGQFGEVKKSSQTVAELSDMRKGANPGLHHAEVRSKDTSE